MTSRGTKHWNSGAIPLLAPDLLGNIIADVADLGIVIDEAGTVLSVLVNPQNELFKKLEEWEGRDLRLAMTPESISKFDNRLRAFLAESAAIRPLEINHTDEDGAWEFPIRYSFHSIGPDGAILLLGRDLRPIAEMQQQLVRAQLALERDYEIQREYDTRFRVLMDSASEGFVFVSAQTGQITDANAIAATLFGKTREALIGDNFSAAFNTRKRSDLMGDLTTQAIADQGEAVQAEFRKSGNIISITPTMFRAAGERFLLCRIEEEANAEPPIDSLSSHLRGMFQSGPDAIAFTTENGGLLAANDGFLGLVDVAHDIKLRGRNIADFLQRGTVDLKIMQENAGRTGKMRSYATKIAGDLGAPRAVDISVTQLVAGKETVFAFILREASRAESITSENVVTSDDGMQSVMALVGSASLKDIVAETTDVVEKMCIQTAVELTMNNRVAAAEMLGLSRQSLYVKLRKFGLLSRDGSDSN